MIEAEEDAHSSPRRRSYPVAARLEAERTGRLRVIGPRPPGVRTSLGEAWRARSALRYFVVTFLRKRYAGTWLGWLWIPLRPTLNIAIGALIYGGVLRVSTGSTPYLLWFVVASASWQLFSETAYYATRSLELARKDLRRVYVPRLIPFVASCVVAVTDFVMYLTIAVGVVAYFAIVDGTMHIEIGWRLFGLIPGCLLLVLLGFSVGIWLAHLAPVARDVRWTLRYVLGLWYLLTPVIYPIDRIPESWRPLASVNPVTGALEVVRWSVFGSSEVAVGAVVITCATVVLVLGSGLWAFARREHADAATF